MHFDELGLESALLNAVRDSGYTEPTPIQEQAIPPLLEGRDVVGSAQTGTGKTAAFALPLMQRLMATPLGGDHRPPRVLVLTPTRELAAQVGESFSTYGAHTPLRYAIVYGGVNQGPQVRALQHGVDVLVATPGRLLDLYQQGHIKLHAVEAFVLDEADRMLDMGFIDDIRRIVGMLPVKRQTLMFSATMPPVIRELADRILHDPVTVAVAPPATTLDTTEQFVYFVEKMHKADLLVALLADDTITRALVFVRTKDGADRLVRHLQRTNIEAAAIHGEKAQKVRETTLDDFKGGTTRVLVATDIASRGLDIDDISHVINYDMPDEPESYVHRIGRTGRAGAAGIAFSLCSIDERSLVSAVERLIGKHLQVTPEHPFRSPLPPPPPVKLGTRAADIDLTPAPGGTSRRSHTAGFRRPRSRGRNR